MQLYEVNGTVTLSRVHPTYSGCCLKTAEPCRAFGEVIDPDLLVVWDNLGASDGSIIAVSDGGEAAQPFRPELKPVDAYNAAIIDEIQLHRPSSLNSGSTKPTLPNPKSTKPKNPKSKN
jgi:microcompartment protein CcmK/EutM